MRTETQPFPHIRDRASVPGILWTVVFALTPALAVSFFFSGWNGVRTVLIALISMLATEAVFRKILKGRPSLYDGSTVITAILFSLLLPPTLPSWMIALGSAVAIALGKEIFGGLGQNPFNPALLGIIFLVSAFPFIRGDFSPIVSLTGQKIGALSILAGGIFLIIKRIVDWEIPFLYLGAVWLFSLPLRQEIPVFLAPFLLAAFFVVTDPVTTPLTRTARCGFAFFAGAFTALLRPFTPPTEALSYALLLANGINPWLERWLRRR